MKYMINNISLLAGLFIGVGIILILAAKPDRETDLIARCMKSIQFVSNHDYVLYCGPRELNDPPQETQNNAKNKTPSAPQKR